jgi:6-phosphogluconolactonase (cycloisomerase 2 family)
MKELIYSFWMLVGTYTGGGSEGIYVYGFDPETAQTELVGVAPLVNPSYLATSADGNVVYAVTENGGEALSFASALDFNRSTGVLSLSDSRPTASWKPSENPTWQGGESPCNITTNGRVVITANYGSGDLSVFGVGENGALTPLKQRIDITAQDPKVPSHAHCVKFSPDGRWLFATDLGKDQILRFAVNENSIDEASQVSFGVPKGSGPRHFVFDKTGRYLYLINELSGTVIVFEYDNGNLKQIQTIQADTAQGHGSADIVMTPDGRWLYASNRLKNDGVAIFEVNPKDGTLTSAGYRTTGIHPRNLSLSPSGEHLLVACRDSDVIEVFAIDHSSGALTPTDKNISVDAPVCVIFIPANRPQL